MVSWLEWVCWLLVGFLVGVDWCDFGFVVVGVVGGLLVLQISC